MQVQIMDGRAGLGGDRSVYRRGRLRAGVEGDRTTWGVVAREDLKAVMLVRR